MSERKTVKDLFGKRINELTFVEDLGKVNGYRKIKCICSCGAEKELAYSNWISGATKTCGNIIHKVYVGRNRGKLIITSVYKKDKQVFVKCLCKCGKKKTFTADKFLHSTSCGEHKRKKTPLVLGEKYGKLTIKENLDNIHRGRRTVKCECECGNKITTLFEYLLDGRVKSCGCLQKQDVAWKNIDRDYKLKGISWDNTYQKWIVRVTENKKRKRIGSTKDITIAREMLEKYKEGVRI